MKYLEVSDFHFSPRWSEISEECGRAVRDAAIKNSVDFIAVPGDLTDEQIVNSTKGGIDKLKKIVKSWLEVCPVCGIEGTRSHDPSGSYGVLVDLGLVLLKPNKVYGWYEGIKAISPVSKDEFTTPNGIIFGVPELNKNTIQAQLGLPADEANGMATTLFKQYVEDFIAPMRMKYANIPAIGLFHGNFSDSQRDNETDIILKASDIVIHTEDLVIANLDRCSLGHIHTPWESKIINAGYPGFTGMDSNPWGKTGFTPAFNFVDNGKITRIPYGTPKRLKVDSVTKITNEPNVAWWVDAVDHLEELPTGLHPWSRITYQENQQDTRRVTEDEAEAVNTLWDLFPMIDPSVDPKLKSKVDLITETIKYDLPGRKNVRVERIKVAGCILFGGKTVEFIISGNGLIMITGENGEGKSSLFSFSHAYPFIIGKDGGNVIKNFFNGKDSYIEKDVYLNDIKHEHLITIRGAHTQNPKTECYLTINGKPQLDKPSLKEMFEKCEELYGNFEHYRITSFWEQPNQASINVSGLMSATTTTARDIVQTISGVGREREKRFALDKVSELEADYEKLKIRKEILESQLRNDLEVKLGNAQDEFQTSKTNLLGLEGLGKQFASKVSELTTYQSKYSEKIRLLSEIDSNNKKIKELKELSGTLNSNRELINADNEALKDQQAVKDYNVSLQLKKSYDDSIKQLSEYVAELKDARILADTLGSEKDKLTDIQHNKDQVKKQNELDNLKAKLESISNPCEHCGKLSSTLQKQVNIIESQIECMFIFPLREVEPESLIHTRIAKAEHAKSSIPVLESRIAKLQDIKEPEILPEPAKTTPPMGSFERSCLEDDIKTAEGAINQIQILMESNESKHPELIDADVDKSIELQTAIQQVNVIRQQYTDCRVELERLTGLISSLTEQIKSNDKAINEILDITAQLESSDIEDWKYIAKMLGSNKIPALELDVFLGVIDAEATRNIEPFLEGLYGFRSTTQENGVDKFDIFVIDRSTGEELSLFKWNPGHKAFFSDAYIKALIRQRNSRMQRSYSPIIFDESDSPIKEHRIPMFYEINRKYYARDNSKVLVVSQKDSAVNYMNKIISMKELKC